MAGELQVVASAPLGGLGAKEGPPATYAYSPPSLIPLFLPWMGILLLFLLPANRSAQAWWVWLPLLALIGLEPVARRLFSEIPSQALDLMSLMYGSLGFGLAGLWLGASFFSRRSRWLAFFGMLVAMTAVGGLACVLRSGEELGAAETTILIVFLGFCVFQVALALSLTSLVCRRRCSPGRFTVWAAVFSAAGWLVCAAPYVILMGIFQGGPEWFEVLSGILLFAGVTFAVVLPFLVLAFLVPFYRERLAGLLQLPLVGGPTAPAPGELPNLDGAKN